VTLQGFEIAYDDGQEIVEVVSDTAGQVPDQGNRISKERQ